MIAYYWQVWSMFVFVFQLSDEGRMLLQVDHPNIGECVHCTLSLSFYIDFGDGSDLCSLFSLFLNTAQVLLSRRDWKPNEWQSKCSHSLRNHWPIIYNNKCQCVSVSSSTCLLHNSKTMKPSGPKLCMHTKGSRRENMNENWVFV